jgi:hypothetical protein
LADYTTKGGVQMLSQNKPNLSLVGTIEDQMNDYCQWHQHGEGWY